MSMSRNATVALALLRGTGRYRRLLPREYAALAPLRSGLRSVW
jgi:hypothetical protein